MKIATKKLLTAFSYGLPNGIEQNSILTAMAFLRLLALLGSVLRLYLTEDLDIVAPVLSAFLAICATGIFSIIDLYHARRGNSVSDLDEDTATLLKIVVEIVLWSWLYHETKSPNSDVFLAYSFPLFLAAAKLPIIRQRFIILLIFPLAYAIAMFSIPASHIFVSGLIRTYLPRIIVFGTLFLTMGHLVQRMRRVTIALKSNVLEAETRSQIISDLRDFEKELNNGISRIYTLPDAARRQQYLVVMTANLVEATGCAFYSLSTNKKWLQSEAVHPKNKLLLEKIPVERSWLNEVLQDTPSIYPPQVISKPSIYDGNRQVNQFIGNAVAVPLKTGASLLGVLAIFNVDNTPLQSESIHRLQRIADLVALALYSGELIRREQLLQDAAKMMNASLALEVVCKQIFSKLRQVVAYDSGSIQQYFSKEKPFTEIVSQYGFNEDIIGQRFYLDQTVPNTAVIQRKKPIRYDDVQREFPSVALVRQSGEIRSWLGLPLLHQGKIIGMITLDRRIDINPFTSEETDFAQVFAAHAAIALNNAISVAEKDDLFRETSAIQDVALRINDSSDAKEIGETILESLHQVLYFDYGMIQVFVGSQRDILARKLAHKDVYVPAEDSHLRRPKAQDRMISEILTKREIVIFDPRQENMRPQAWEKLPSTTHICSWVGIPLIMREREYGIMILEHHSEAFYTMEHINLLRPFQVFAATVLGDKILNEELNKVIDELTRNNFLLDRAIQVMSRSSRLVKLGIIHGETLHYVGNTLEITRKIIEDIQNGEYDSRQIERNAAFKKALRNLDAFVTKVSGLSDNPELEFVTFDLYVVLEQVIQAQPRRERVEIIKERNPMAGLNIFGPEQVMHDVFQNIVRNAFTAMENDGTLTISAVETSRNNTACVCITIRDTGRGLSSQHLSMLNSSQRSMSRAIRKRRRGLGMGLAWTIDTLWYLGGDIVFESRGPKLGTSVHVYVPKRFESSNLVPAYDLISTIGKALDNSSLGQTEAD